MKIKLIETGGILPVTKEASAEVDWTSVESEEIIKKITVSNTEINPGLRDGIDHILEINGKEISINLNKADGKFAAIFNELKSKLKIIKT